MPARSVQIVQQAMEAFNRRDLDALAELYAPDISASAGPLWPAAGAVTGREPLLGAYASIFDVFAHTEVVPDEIVDLGEAVLVAIRWRGAVTQGDVVAEQQLCCMCVVRGEVLVRIDWYATRAEAMAAYAEAPTADRRGAS